jgi:hypothetical protein
MEGNRREGTLGLFAEYVPPRRQPTVTREPVVQEPIVQEPPQQVYFDHSRETYVTAITEVGGVKEVSLYMRTAAKSQTLREGDTFSVGALNNGVIEQINVGEGNIVLRDGLDRRVVAIGESLRTPIALPRSEYIEPVPVTTAMLNGGGNNMRGGGNNNMPGGNTRGGRNRNTMNNDQNSRDTSILTRSRNMTDQAQMYNQDQMNQMYYQNQMNQGYYMMPAQSGQGMVMYEGGQVPQGMVLVPSNQAPEGYQMYPGGEMMPQGYDMTQQGNTAFGGRGGRGGRGGGRGG